MPRAKRNINTVTNIQLALEPLRPSPQYAEVFTVHRFFSRRALYLAALYNIATVWDSGMPEWVRGNATELLRYNNRREV